MIPISYEVAKQMFDDAPPGTLELDEATQLCIDAIVRERLREFFDAIEAETQFS